MDKNREDSEPQDERTFLVADVPTSLLEYLHACPICFHDGLDHYCREPSLFDPPEYIHYERCLGCGVVFRNPRMPSLLRESKYEDKIMPESAKALNPVNQIHYAYMMRLLTALKPSQVGNRLFDFGCGGGQFLVEAKKENFDVMGLELNKDLVEFVGREYGFPVHEGLIMDPKFADERFDVIISSQVFEHLVDPRGSLEALLEHLNKPGLILIEVPNLMHIRERLKRGVTMDDSHLFYFSSRSLPAMMERAGCRVIKVQQGMRPYRFFKGPVRSFPDTFQDLGMRILSSLGVRTGLSVIAVYE